MTEPVTRAEMDRALRELRAEIFGHTPQLFAGDTGAIGRLENKVEEVGKLIETKCKEIMDQIATISLERTVELTEKKTRRDTFVDWSKAISWALAALVGIITVARTFMDTFGE